MYLCVFDFCLLLSLSPSLPPSSSVIGAVARVGEEEAAQVVVQGGLRATIATSFAFPGSRNVQYSVMRICQFLAKDPDNLAVMAAENVIAPLKVAKSKFSCDYEVSVLFVSNLIGPFKCPGCTVMFAPVCRFAWSID